MSSNHPRSQVPRTAVQDPRKIHGRYRTGTLSPSTVPSTGLAGFLTVHVGLPLAAARLAYSSREIDPHDPLLRVTLLVPYLLRTALCITVPTVRYCMDVPLTSQWMRCRTSSTVCTSYAVWIHPTWRHGDVDAPIVPLEMRPPCDIRPPCPCGNLPHPRAPPPAVPCRHLHLSTVSTMP